MSLSSSNSGELLPLPSVRDGDRKVLSKITPLLAQLIDGDIPGIGILHTKRKEQAAAEIYYSHGKIVLKGLARVEPGLDFDPDMPGELGPYGNGIAPHADVKKHRAPYMRDGRHLEMVLRLHSAVPSVGARIVMANTAPGALVIPGDYDAYQEFNRFELSKEGYDRGYDDSLGMTYDSFGGDYQTAFDPNNLYINDTLIQPEIYEFLQAPGDSILFRRDASMGPVSAHGFSSAGRGGGVRHAYAAQIAIFSQTL